MPYGSWDPKAVLTKQISDDESTTQWWLWIGSRNLTRDLAWDVGLALVSHSDGDAGSEIRGIPEQAHNLAQHAALPGVSPIRIRSELQRVRWDAPSGCSVKTLRLPDLDSSCGLSAAPQQLGWLIVVSPFLDGTVVGSLGKWSDAETNRVLVSSRVELAKLTAQKGKSLMGFNDVLFLDAPVPDEQAASDVSERENSDSEDEEPEPRGLMPN